MSIKNSSKSKKLDRRVRRTRKYLGTALLDLIVERGYDLLTIQDITDRADLNRATFYLHYGSKEELLIATLEAKFDELIEQHDMANPTQPVWENPELDIMTYQHVADNAPLYKVLLSKQGMGYLIYRVIDYIAAYSNQQLKNNLPSDFTPGIPADLIAQHVAGSLFAMISWWVQNDMPYSPEEMADMTHKLCTHGVIHLLRNDVP